jgi:hypothetical protein
MKALATKIIGQMFQEVDDFAFTGGRAADEDYYIKGVIGHRNPTVLSGAKPPAE